MRLPLVTMAVLNITPSFFGESFIFNDKRRKFRELTAFVILQSY
ncbi:MAG: hypothetical protein R3E32_10385 [Chitinophagales bacterium]